MREPTLPDGASEGAVFAACVASVLELRLDEVPVPDGPLDAVPGRLARWLGGLGMGLVPVAGASTFGWAGPWIARVRTTAGVTSSVVMYGSPFGGVGWDPAGVTASEGWIVESGYVIAALDVALARPPRWAAPALTGRIEGLFIAAQAGAPAQAVSTVRALAGRGLEGDRHAVGTGTFPSGVAGSALTLIEAEVCESFTPPLGASVHRRNIVTRGIELNGLVGHEILIGSLRGRGVRLCEPCVVLDRYAGQRIVRPLVHRGGLRVDILDDGVISVGDPIRIA